MHFKSISLVIILVAVLVCGCGGGGGPIYPGPGTLIANFIHSAAAGYLASQDISFDASSSVATTHVIESYEWDFGDGTDPVTSSTPAMTHVYTRAGRYQVNLIVHNTYGQSDATSDNLEILMTINLVATVNFPTTVSDVDISGSYAFVVEGGNTLDVFDIIDPETPTEVANLEIEDGLSTIKISGQYAYLVDPYDGVHVIDISDPLNPWEVSEITVGGMNRVVCPYDQYILVGVHNPGSLDVFDMANPALPSSLGSVGMPGDFGSTGWDAAVWDNYVYITSFYSIGWTTYMEITAVDLTDPSAPIVINEFGTRNVTYGHFAINNLATSGGYLYASDETGQMDIYDLADPSHLSVAATFVLSGLKGDIVSDMGRLYMSSVSELRVYDISIPLDLLDLGSYMTRTGPLAVSEPYILSVTGMGATMLIFECIG